MLKKGKVGVIIGYSSEIGEDACRFLSDNGFNIAVITSDDHEENRLTNGIRENNGNVKHWRMHSFNGEEMQRTFSDIYQTFGEISLVINTNHNGKHEITGAAACHDNDSMLNNLTCCSESLYPFFSKNNCTTVLNVNTQQ